METREIIRKLSDLGVPQEGIASIAGVSQGRISQILNGGGDCSFSAGKRLSELLERLQLLGDDAARICPELSKAGE